MTRKPGWESAIVDVINYYSTEPFEWGGFDCFHMMGDNIQAVIGADPFEEFYGYQTEAGAYRRLQRTGFDTLGDFLADKFEEIPPSLGQRGDIGVISRDGVDSGGVFTSFGFASKAEHGVIYEPITAVSRAFKIG